MSKKFIRKLKNYILGVLALMYMGYIMCLASYWDMQEKCPENYTQEELTVDSFSDLWIF